MMNNPHDYLNRLGIAKSVSKSAEASAKSGKPVKVREHERMRPMSKPDANERKFAVTSPMVKVARPAPKNVGDDSATPKSGKIECNESAKYEAAERRAVCHFAKESVLREGHNTGAGKYKGKSLAPGGGGRFAQMTDALKREGKSEDSAKAIAAAAGRKKYGAKKMASFAAAGKKRAK